MLPNHEKRLDCSTIEKRALPRSLYPINFLFFVSSTIILLTNHTVSYVALGRSGSRSPRQWRSKFSRIVPYFTPLRSAKSSTPRTSGVDRSGTSVARTNRRRVSELIGIPNSLAKRAPACASQHETNGLQLRYAAFRPPSIRAPSVRRTVRQMCVENKLCWSRQNGAHEFLAAPAYRPSSSLRWYACNNCEPAAKRSDK